MWKPSLNFSSLKLHQPHSLSTSHRLNNSFQKRFFFGSRFALTPNEEASKVETKKKPQKQPLSKEHLKILEQEKEKLQKFDEEAKNIEEEPDLEKKLRGILNKLQEFDPNISKIFSSVHYQRAVPMREELLERTGADASDILSRLKPHNHPRLAVEFIPPGRAVRFCRCWGSKNFPYCDGSHATIPDWKLGPVIVRGIVKAEFPHTPSLDKPDIEEKYPPVDVEFMQNYINLQDSEEDKKLYKEMAIDLQRNMESYQEMEEGLTTNDPIISPEKVESWLTKRKLPDPAEEYNAKVRERKKQLGIDLEKENQEEQKFLKYVKDEKKKKSLDPIEEVLFDDEIESQRSEELLERQLAFLNQGNELSEEEQVERLEELYNLKEVEDPEENLEYSQNAPFKSSISAMLNPLYWQADVPTWFGKQRIIRYADSREANKTR